MPKVTAKKSIEKAPRTLKAARSKKEEFKKKVFNFIYKLWLDTEGPSDKNEGNEIMLDIEEDTRLQQVFQTKKEMHEAIAYLLKESVIFGPDPEEAEEENDYSYEWTGAEDFAKFMRKNMSLKEQKEFVRTYDGYCAADHLKEGM